MMASYAVWEKTYLLEWLERRGQAIDLRSSCGHERDEGGLC